MLWETEERLIHGLVSLPPAQHRSCSLSRGVPDRWLLASALQKCIRRGLHAEAVEVAAALHAMDAEYAWRRLRVIALEDVGLGNIERVSAVLAIAGKRRVRDAFGDLRLLTATAHSLSVGLKDRTACDLLRIGCSPEAASFRSTLLEAPLRWEPLALDERAPVWRRVVALQLLAGLTERTRAGYRTLSRANPHAVLRVVEALKPHPLVAYAVVRGKGTESLNVALLFAHLLRESTDHRPIVSRVEEIQNCPRIGGLIAPTFCMYTRVGLRALRTFLCGDAELRATLRNAGANNGFEALGLLLFQVESGLLDRAEDYAHQVRIEAERAELMAIGIGDDAAGATLRMLVRCHLPMLNKARRAAWRAYLTDAKVSGAAI